MSDQHDIDDLISVLDHRLRREVIHYLSVGPGRRTDLDEIADFVCRTRRKEGEVIDRDDLALRLHHLHLPKLADIGLIEFDPISGQVRYIPDSKMESLLERIEGA